MKKFIKRLIKLFNKMKEIENYALKANLLLLREIYTEKSTIGKLYFNGNFYGHTLELPYLDNQRSISSIPKGVYQVEKRAGEESPKFKYQHLIVKDVPNRSYILFHVGNYPKDTKGCVLIGNTKSLNAIGESTKAFNKLMYDLQPYTKIELVIKNK